MFLGIRGIGRFMYHAVRRFINAITFSAGIFKSVLKDA